jgi:glycosidase
MTNTPWITGGELTSEFNDLTLLIDPETGGPSRVQFADATGVDLSTRVSLVDGGTEHRGPDGGLVYHDTRTVEPVRIADTQIRTSVGMTERHFDVPVELDHPDWSLTWRYTFRADHPRIAVDLVIVAQSDQVILRNVHVDVTSRLGSGDAWTVHAPGNQIRRDLALDDLTAPVAILPIAGVAGSAGIVGFEHTANAQTLIVWPMSTTEIGDPILHPSPDGPRLAVQTDVAGQPGRGGTLAYRSLHLDLIPQPFAAILKDVPSMLAGFGMSGPDDPPTWARGASIYEVQVGFGVFANGYRYEPYRTAGDLLADLDRIESLGFEALQIMPRQPYPSYNVHDYADITTTYGDEQVLRQLVDECHRRGMHVILDILMHGVIDGEAVDGAIDGIRNGPVADKLSGPAGDITALTFDESEEVLITWSKHVIDFGPHWSAGSPRHHPLLDEHPEWFCTDSDGRVTGRYTQAFDVSHPGWQRYFVDSCLDLVRRLDVDGFRLDAPGYNYFHNWSPRTRTNAAVSMLGSLHTFEMLRGELRALKPTALLYTEPSGTLFRMAMDLNYNYDEQWLLRAVMTGGAGQSQWVRNAREMSEWLADRDATLPRGSLTAHHIDSHDTFWWPEPGSKWRREQYGVPATAALMSVFALSGEPYMTFVGGEVDIEEQVRAVHRLRRDHPEFAIGTTDRTSLRCSDDHVYAVLRRGTSGTSMLLVNLSDQHRSITVDLAPDALDGPPHSRDLLGDMTLSWSSSNGRLSTAVELEPYQAVAVPLDRNTPAR